MALDGKMAFEANALYRHPDVVELSDLSEEDAGRIEAKEYDLSFIKLDGDIGCMVNGAGLAMATMDIIKTVGGEPANFLDVGGGADQEKVTAAFKIITKDPNVKGIFVNIFGGIMRCDIIAEGVIAAVEEVGLSVPLVVRLEGRMWSSASRCSMSRVPGSGECDRHERRRTEDRGADEMSVLIGTDTKVLVQGLGKTGRSTPTRRSPTARTWSAAVHPGRGGSHRRL